MTTLITADGAYHCPVGSKRPFFKVKTHVANYSRPIMSDGKDCTRGFRSISASKDSTQSPCVVWNQFPGRRISLWTAFFFSHFIPALVDIFLFFWHNFFFKGGTGDLSRTGSVAGGLGGIVSGGFLKLGYIPVSQVYIDIYMNNFSSDQIIYSLQICFMREYLNLQEKHDNWQSTQMDKV